MEGRVYDATRWCHKPSQFSFDGERPTNNRSSSRKPKNRVETIHASMKSSNGEGNVKRKTLASDQERFFSFSSILSTRQRRLERPSFASQSEHQGSNLPIYLPHDRSTTLAQVNRWNENNGNIHFTPSYTLTSMEEDRQRFPRKNLSISDETNRFPVKNEYGTITDERKRSKCLPTKSFRACSIPCILLSLLIGSLLIGAIVGTVVGVLVTPNKASITTTTLSTTTITPTVCSCLCPGESWRFDSGYLARWTFDGTFNELTNTYNATSYNPPSFATGGYVNQAAFFNASTIQSLSTTYIPLAHTSFTVEVWLKPTFTSGYTDHSILGLCPSATDFECLHLVIRKIGSNNYLYLGFFNHDCQGNTALTANQWIHAAFVFDLTTLTQSIYLNGELDNNCTTSSPIIATTGLITIGTVPNTIPFMNMNFYEGYMDHLTITKRAKSACEIQEDASLAGCFLFDSETPYSDSGPNSLQSVTSSTTVVSSGHHDKAISLNGTAYFQASSFTALGISSKAFSIVLWIRPRSILGTIVHVSSNSLGTAWCIPFLGITANGSLAAQMYVAGAVTVWGPSLPMSPVWSHIAQTWSLANGLRLYIDGVLVASLASTGAYTASGVSNYVTLANSRNGVGLCAGGAFGFYAPQPLACDIDDFRVYGRELSAIEISTIYQT